MWGFRQEKRGRLIERKKGQGLDYPFTKKGSKKITIKRDQSLGGLGQIAFNNPPAKTKRRRYAREFGRRQRNEEGTGVDKRRGRTRSLFLKIFLMGTEEMWEAKGGGCGVPRKVLKRF